MGTKVTITIEQDDVAGQTPVAITWTHRMHGGGSNPRYVGDAMQTAVVRAATDVVRHVAGWVDLRSGEEAIHACEDLTSSVEIGGNQT